VSFRVESDETVALVGPSGAGKSTIDKLLLRFYDLTSSQIRLDGHDIRDLTLYSLRANIAMVLQETLTFDGTVRENNAYGRPDATEDEIVREAQAADTSSSHPCQSDTRRLSDRRVGACPGDSGSASR
jgi:subfamily B ATP-binding cassette protein MsbA